MAGWSWNLTGAVWCGARMQGVRTDMSGACFRTDWSWGLQEHAANGREGCGRRHDQLHHFVADGVWRSGPLEVALLAGTDRLIAEAVVLVVNDDTCLSKTGGSSRQCRVAICVRSTGLERVSVNQPHILPL
ncbi:transposase [Paenirhodobacter sp.]|uniref:transposase n=1 Tax=Paenirhodobacter sp. TaxID=1965326 RepID=UPI003B50175C